jgi:DNA repair protein SbcC/Rad50
MRLHRLRATAFGPFAGSIDVDLDAVAESGLFLIHGATGAGKTSLLDAVAFALFADVPGSRSKKGLHSDHADRGAVPQVSLELTASGRRLKIDRSPEFYRPKARGAGETKVPAKAVLSEHRGGRWEALSTRHDEIADVVKDVLGMGLEQFSKVVLLPQGDFAAFLRATPEERRGLLERMFDVSTYAGIEDWFILQRKESGAALESHRAALRSDLAVLADVLADAPLVCPDPAGTDMDFGELSVEELPAAIDAVRASLVDASIQTLTTVDATKLADTAATTAHTSAAEAAARRQRGRSAQRVAAALEERRADHERRTARLERGARAASLSGDLKALARAENAVADARSALTAAADRVAGWQLVDGATAPVDVLRGRLERGSGSLADVAKVLRTVDSRRRVRDQLAARSTELRAGVAEVTEQLAERTAAAESAQVALESALAASARVDSAAQLVARLQNLHRLRAEAEAGRTRLEQARERLGTERSTAQDARDAYQDLRQARLDGMAGELAGRLAQDHPCPVCGSCDHPDPASSGDLVSPETVGAAESLWQEAAVSVSRTEAAIAALQATQVQYADQLAGETRDVDALSEALHTGQMELSALRRSAAGLERARLTVDSVAATIGALTTEAAQLHDELTAATSSTAAVDADLAEQEATAVAAVSDHHSGCPCLELEPPSGDDHAERLPDLGELREMVAAHERAVAALQRYASAADVLARARRDQVEVRAATQDALAAAGFPDAVAARAALLPAGEISQLRTELREHDEAVVSARTTLEDPEIRAALEAPPADLDALAARQEQARSAYVAAVSADTLVRRTLAGVDRVRASTVQRCHAIARASTHDDVLRELADTLTGTGANNTLRMRLSAFVLAARLERVAILANERLATMGGGRYQLRHTDGLAARGARSGLGLEVLDLWTGQARDTSSLSGGESFMASLALALGLADAVREEAGGFDLQTLFVDEGFGTLDDESLEQVMAVLDGLREGGRAVGVVSHVAELRTRIPSQVVVTKTERGSSVRTTVSQDATPAA